MQKDIFPISGLLTELEEEEFKRYLIAMLAACGGGDKPGDDVSFTKDIFSAMQIVAMVMSRKLS
ncbi:hypothetical protein D9O50_02720 [Oxalobacteraceae bacterium CAVE-383]|nr:hypothetical protein D9O50_02720 [Oxalobacteraceae bacterium CAVE-383]